MLWLNFENAQCFEGIAKKLVKETMKRYLILQKFSDLILDANFSLTLLSSVIQA